MDDPLSTTGNHLTREIKAAFCDAINGQNGQDRIDAGPADLRRCGRAWAAATSGPGDIIAAFHNMIDDGPDFFCVGIDHPLALKRAEDPDLRPTGGLLDARPLGRRLRLGHHQQGHRHHRRQRLRQGRAGLSQVRLREEGPADHLLPDHRRLAHLHRTASWSTSTWCASTTRPPSSVREPLKGLVPGGAIFMQSPARPIRARSGSAFPSSTRSTIRDKKLRVYYADMVRIAREVASVADLQMRMQGIVLLGAFLKLTPYAGESEMTDEQVYAGVEKALRKYFGKRGDRVVQDNLTCVKRGYSEMKEVPADHHSCLIMTR